MILVTGATGFIGPRVVKALRGRDLPVRALVRSPGAEAAATLAAWGAELVQGDMTEPDTHLPPEVEADLVALADGNLRPSRRVEVEARVAADPELAAALERQRRALSML